MKVEKQLHILQFSCELKQIYDYRSTLKGRQIFFNSKWHAIATFINSIKDTFWLLGLLIGSANCCFHWYFTIVLRYDLTYMTSQWGYPGGMSPEGGLLSRGGSPMENNPPSGDSPSGYPHWDVIFMLDIYYWFTNMTVLETSKTMSSVVLC